MAKKKITAVAAAEPPKMCNIHSRPLKFSTEQNLWYCSDCLQSAYLSWQAQQQAVKRYRESDKGKEAQGRYEQSEKGLTARQRYLKSDKYKQRRKEYNDRLKESLHIAREANLDRSSAIKAVEQQATQEMSPLMADIMEFQDTMGHNPSTAEVREWATEVYKTPVTPDKARELIELATKRRHK